MKNNLKELRQKENISQDDLASILKVSRQTINSIETGKFDPSLKLVMKMTQHFNVPWNKYLFMRKKNDRPSLLIIAGVTIAIWNSITLKFLHYFFYLLLSFNGCGGINCCFCFNYALTVLIRLLFNFLVFDPLVF